MSMKRLLPYLILGGLFSGDERKVSIPSHKIERPRQHTELSKRKLQKMKGEKARKNRGNKRKELK